MALSIKDSLLKIPELILRGKFSFTFDRIPVTTERLSQKQKANLIISGIDMVFNNRKLLSLPPVLQIEPANICNLRCPLCPSGEGSMNREKGFMELNIFQKILTELGDVLIAAILYGWGEPFMNRHIASMIMACSKRNIRTIISTNGHFIQTYEEALNIVEAGLSVLIIAIDGYREETYNSYRKSGNLEKVRACITLIEEAKRKTGSKLPYTNLRTVVTDKNHKEIPLLKQLAEELNVNMFSCKSLGCMPNNENFKDYEPSDINIKRYNKKNNRFFKCSYPFRQPVIFRDGTVSGCEFDYNLDHSWGNIKENEFKNIWNSHKSLELRKAIIDGGSNLPSFCSL